MEENKVNNTNEESSFKSFYNKHKSTFNFILMILSCLLVAKLVTTFMFLSVMVDGNSMAPTLTNGEKAITDGLFYRMSGIDRFDIVILEEDGFEDKLVKRVIGLPGETIEYIDSVLYINGEKVEEKFLPEGVKTEMRYNKNFKVTLEKDEYYVLGDNRANSTDSRVFGPIKKSQIKGVGMMVFAGCSTVTKDGSCKGLKLKWPKVVK